VYYSNSNRPTDQTYWDKHLFNNDNNNSIILGDFNAHHPCWHSSSSNATGRAIFKAYSKSNFILCNSDTPTTTSTPNRSPSVLDLSFLTPELYTLMTKWQVGSDPMGSDHMPIFISLDNSTQRSKDNISNLPRRRNSKLANWNLYKESVEKHLKELGADNQDNFKQIPIEEVQDIINKAADLAIPYFKPPNLNTQPIHQKFITKSWWTAECSKAIAYRRLALKIFRTQMTPLNFQKYQSAQIKARAIINEAKRQGWNK